MLPGYPNCSFDYVFNGTLFFRLGIDGLNESDLESGESDSEEQGEEKEITQETTIEIKVTKKTVTRV